MEKKYELTESKIYCGITLYRIKALRDLWNVKAGDLGGWVESELNLSHEGNCWIYNDAITFKNKFRQCKELYPEYEWRVLTRKDV